jgi:hypothetical protein
VSYSRIKSILGDSRILNDGTHDAIGDANNSHTFSPFPGSATLDCVQEAIEESLPCVGGEHVECIYHDYCRSRKCGHCGHQR